MLERVPCSRQVDSECYGLCGGMEIAENSGFNVAEVEQLAGLQTGFSVLLSNTSGQGFRGVFCVKIFICLQRILKKQYLISESR